MNLLKPYLWRVSFTVLGLVAAILFLLLGFIKTAVILLCCGIGFIIGAYKDTGRRPEWLLTWFRRDRW